MENRLVDMRELYQEWQDYHLHHQDNPVSWLDNTVMSNVIIPLPGRYDSSISKHECTNTIYDTVNYEMRTSPLGRFWNHEEQRLSPTCD